MSAPLGPPARYDCVIDDGVRLQRVQIKTGWEDGCGAVCWETRSREWRRSGSRGYRGQADLFAVWVPETGRCYLVPVAECGAFKASLRLTPARNNQRKGVRLASDYELVSGRTAART